MHSSQYGAHNKQHATPKGHARAWPALIPQPVCSNRHQVPKACQPLSLFSRLSQRAAVRSRIRARSSPRKGLQLAFDFLGHISALCGEP